MAATQQQQQHSWDDKGRTRRRVVVASSCSTFMVQSKAVQQIGNESRRETGMYASSNLGRHNNNNNKTNVPFLFLPSHRVLCRPSSFSCCVCYYHADIEIVTHQKFIVFSTNRNRNRKRSVEENKRKGGNKKEKEG